MAGRANVNVPVDVWRPFVNGQAEMAGIPPETSKRPVEVDIACVVKVVEFGNRHVRDPSQWEHAALTMN